MVWKNSLTIKCRWLPLKCKKLVFIQIISFYLNILNNGTVLNLLELFNLQILGRNRLNFAINKLCNFRRQVPLPRRKLPGSGKKLPDLGCYYFFSPWATSKRMNHSRSLGKSSLTTGKNSGNFQTTVKNYRSFKKKYRAIFYLVA